MLLIWQYTKRFYHYTHVAATCRRHLREVADHINHALLEPLEEYRLTEDIPKLPLEEDQPPEFLVVTAQDVYTRLSRLNPAKAGGPDGIPNWILRGYAEFLAIVNGQLHVLFMWLAGFQVFDCTFPHIIS